MWSISFDSICELVFIYGDLRTLYNGFDGQDGERKRIMEESSERVMRHHFILDD